MREDPAGFPAHALDGTRYQRFRLPAFASCAAKARGREWLRAWEDQPPKQRVHDSSISVYGLVRLGSSLSLLDFATLGSSLSLRSYGRMGSSMSVYGITRLCSSLSVLDFVNLGSCMSRRALAPTVTVR